MALSPSRVRFTVPASTVPVSTAQGAAPALPATVKSLDVATGAITNVPVVWDPVDPSKYVNRGSFPVNGVALMSVFAPRRLLTTFAVIAAMLVATTMLTHGDVALWSIVAIGLFNSIMFPTIFTLAIERLGPLTDKASSLLVMAIVGGAIVPLLEGALADRIGVQHAFVLPLLCYAYIVFYSMKGSRVA